MTEGYSVSTHHPRLATPVMHLQSGNDVYVHPFNVFYRVNLHRILVPSPNRFVLVKSEVENIKVGTHRD